jgi:hypothetical protein
MDLEGVDKPRGAGPCRPPDTIPCTPSPQPLLFSPAVGDHLLPPVSLAGYDHRGGPSTLMDVIPAGSHPKDQNTRTSGTCSGEAYAPDFPSQSTTSKGAAVPIAKPSAGNGKGSK